MKVTPRRSIEHQSSNGELTTMKETMIFDGQVRVAMEAGQESQLEQAKCVGKTSLFSDVNVIGFFHIDCFFSQRPFLQTGP